MVEHQPDDLDLDAVFKALGHLIRREILEQFADGPESVGELADPYDVSLAAVSKHLRVLENAGLLDIEENGRVRRCHLDAAPLSEAFGWLTRYRVLWGTASTRWPTIWRKTKNDIKFDRQNRNRNEGDEFQPSTNIPYCV